MVGLADHDVHGARRPTLLTATIRCRPRQSLTLQLLPRAKVAQPRGPSKNWSLTNFQGYGLLAYGLPWCMVSSRR